VTPETAGRAGPWVHRHELLEARRQPEHLARQMRPDHPLGVVRDEEDVRLRQAFPHLLHHAGPDRRADGSVALPIDTGPRAGLPATTRLLIVVGRVSSTTRPSALTPIRSSSCVRRRAAASSPTTPTTSTRPRAWRCSPRRSQPRRSSGSPSGPQRPEPAPRARFLKPSPTRTHPPSHRRGRGRGSWGIAPDTGTIFWESSRAKSS